MPRCLALKFRFPDPTCTAKFCALASHDLSNNMKPLSFLVVLIILSAALWGAGIVIVYDALAKETVSDSGVALARYQAAILSTVRRRPRCALRTLRAGAFIAAPLARQLGREHRIYNAPELLHAKASLHGKAGAWQVAGAM